MNHPSDEQRWPTRAPGADAPWAWVSQAVGIYRRQAVLATGYGLTFVLGGYFVLWGLWKASLMSALPVAIGGFALAGPLFAAGLYAIARADEEGRKATFREVLIPAAASPQQIAYLGVLMFVAAGLWALTAAGLLITMAEGQARSLEEFSSFALSTPRGLFMVAVGSILGGLIAGVIFSVSAFSIPLLFDRKADFATAIGTSVRTVWARPAPMLLWAWVIGLSIAVGGVTLLLGFVVLFPLLGFATWVGYRDFLKA